MSTLDAQFTAGSYFSATRSSPVARPRVGEAVAIEMREERPFPAADRLIRQDHLVDAVIVPFVVRGHL